MSATRPLLLACLALGATTLAVGSSRAEPAADPGATLRFEDAGGKLVLKIERTERGFKLVDPDGKTVGKLKVDEDRVKLRDPATDQDQLKVKRKDHGAEIEDGAGNRRFKIKPKDDGTLELEDAGGSRVAKLKPKDAGGIEVRDGAGATLAKVKVREGKLVFETEGGDRLGQLEGTTNARAGAWLAIEALTPSERAAVYAYYDLVDR